MRYAVANDEAPSMGGVRTNLPIAVKALRRRRRWRQQDLGGRAGLSRDLISRTECGELHGITIGSLAQVARALDAVLVVELRWQGADLDRLVDRAHAGIQGGVVGRLRAAGWLTHVEVSFNHYGDRGRCDIVAWHPPTRTLLIVEVKSRLGDLQEMLGALHVKARLGRLLAEQIGCPDPAFVVQALVLADDRTARRLLARHSSLFERFALRGRAATRWIRAPIGGPSGLLWFEVLTDSDGSRTNHRQRVRAGRPAA